MRVGPFYIYPQLSKMIRYDKGDNEIVLCRTFSNDTEAWLAKGELERHGIACIIDNDVFSRIYPIGFNSIGGLRLMVRNKDLERALDLLKDI